MTLIKETDKAKKVKKKYISPSIQMVVIEQEEGIAVGSAIVRTYDNEENIYESWNGESSRNDQFIW